MTTEKKAVVDILKNSYNIVKEIGKVCREITSIQLDKTWNRLIVHNLPVEDRIHFILGNIRQGILKIKQDLEE